MFSNLKTVLKELGSILVILGVLMFSLLVVAYVFEELYVIKPLVFTAIAALALGLALRFSFKNAKEPEFKHAMVCAALAWLVVPALSSLLFIMIEGMSPLDSFFEAMSGWTGTGLTMIAHPSSLTHTAQFWRSLMQWVGGVGVIVLMLSILARPGTGAFSLYKAEAREERIKPSIISTVRITWWIYLILTSFGILLFFFSTYIRTDVHGVPDNRCAWVVGDRADYHVYEHDNRGWCGIYGRRSEINKSGNSLQVDKMVITEKFFATQSNNICQTRR